MSWARTGATPWARHALVALLFVTLAACQTTAHRFSRTQQTALHANGFVETADGWELSMADRLLFDTDSATLKPDINDTLGRVATSLLHVGIDSARVEGHSDSTGASDHNMDLSVNRARAVSAKLQSFGFTADKLTVQGWGETHPVADNATEEGRALNRRVVIIVTP